MIVHVVRGSLTILEIKALIILELHLRALEPQYQ